MAAEGGSQLKLHGFWSSPYVHRVIWALKLKGLEYEYVEEDLSNKSQALLEYNPAHTKVPVLVHAGRPLFESGIILQYIEETWPNPENPLFPLDPALLLIIRLLGRQVVTYWAYVRSSEEDKEKTANDALETLRIIQDKALGDKKFFNGDRIGLVDLMFGWLAGPWFDSTQEYVGLRLLKPDILPKLHRWAMDFQQVQIALIVIV